MPTIDSGAPRQQREVEGELARLRAELLEGRGPGAGALEVLGHTRGREHIGDLAVSRMREDVSRQAAVARRDPAALARDVADDRAQLGTAVRALRAGLRPSGRRAGRRALPWCLVAAQALVLVVAAARARRRR